ncbi:MULTISPECIES: hypothetical protein [unclassified Streptomyces]|uniref:hypothetical protein n=1 Tax=unclassified Streptomyces TaxID=2593676 RepID=UPI0038122C35
MGEPDEADLVAYLDAGHDLMDVPETGWDVLTGMGHRHSVGCSSLMKARFEAAIPTGRGDRPQGRRDLPRKRGER